MSPSTTVTFHRAAALDALDRLARPERFAQPGPELVREIEEARCYLGRLAELGETHLGPAGELSISRMDAVLEAMHSSATLSIQLQEHRRADSIDAMVYATSPVLLSRRAS